MRQTTAPLNRVHDLLALGTGGAAFVCSASFEDRSSSVASRLGGAVFARAFIVWNADHAALHIDQLERLRAALGAGAAVVDLESTSPLASAEALDAVVGECMRADVETVVVDTTTFTHESLLVLLFLLRRHAAAGGRVCLTYTKARAYATNEQGDQKWLSRGVRDIRSVYGYPGAFAPSRKLHLVVLGGFEHERAAEVIRCYEPHRISLGTPAKAGPTAETHSPLARRRLDYLRSVFGQAETFEFSVDDVGQACEAVARVIALHPDHNVVVAALNTKLATVGTALAAMSQPAVQLCYAQPLVYNYRHYSEPADECVVVSDLPLPAPDVPGGDNSLLAVGAEPGPGADNAVGAINPAPWAGALGGVAL